MLWETVKRNAPRHTWTKLFGHTLAISAFFAVYLTVAAHPQFPVTEMPRLAVDAWAPLMPWSVWIYFSLWVYICLPAVFMGARRQLLDYFLGGLLMAVIGIIIFIFWPTSMPDNIRDWSDYPATLRFMKAEELSRNACPSLHVSYAVFAALWLHSLLRRAGAGRLWLAFNGLWATTIVLSTLTTRQHVVIDVFFGALLGVLIFAINRCWVRRDEPLA